MNSFIRFPRVTRMIFFYMRGVIHASASQLQPKRDSNISPPPTSEKMIHMFMMLNNVWAFQSWGAMVVSVYFALCVCAEFVQSFHRVKHTLIYSIQIHRITRTSESIDNMFMFAVVLICIMDFMMWVSCVLVLQVLREANMMCAYATPRSNMHPPTETLLKIIRNSIIYCVLLSNYAYVVVVVILVWAWACLAICAYVLR